MDYLIYTQTTRHLLEMIVKGKMFSLQQVVEKSDCLQSTVDQF
jgi:hypothetical protein